jgi:hypothetical protein
VPQQFAEAFQRSLDANDVATLHRMWPAETRIGGWEKAYLQPRLALGERRRTSLEYLQDVNPHPPARGMTLSYRLEFERGEAYEQFAIRMDGNVPHLIAYQFFPGKRFECYPIGGCRVVDVPQKTALR